MIALLILVLSTVASAAQLRLDLDSRKLQVGQTVSLSLQVIDGRVSGIPSLPADPGLSLRFQKQRTDRVSVNFQSTRIISYVFALTAVSPGTHTLGPLDLEVGGERLHLDAITIEVAAQPEGVAGPGLSAELSELKPWLGQTVVYGLRFRHQDQLRDDRWSLPDFDGFVQEKTAEGVRREYVEELEGERYGVVAVDLALVAVGEGSRTISPGLVEAAFDDKQAQARRRDPRSPVDLFEDFGLSQRVRQVTVTSPTLSTEVRPLPTDGRPASFTGLVGRFVVAVEPSATSVPLGESVTLEISVVGDGTLAGFELPPPPSGAGFRAYDDKPEVHAVIQDGAFLTRAVFKRAIVPEQVGTLTVPPVRLSVFDPDAGAYVTVESKALGIEVLPGDGAVGEVSSFGGAPVSSQQEVSVLGDDILPAPGGARIGDGRLSAVLPLAGAIVAIPALGWMGLGLAGLKRREDPWAELQARLASLPEEPDARLAALEAIFRGAVGLRTGTPAPAVDEEVAAGVGEEACYRDLRAARYGGADVGDLADHIRAFVGRRGQA